MKFTTDIEHSPPLLQSASYQGSQSARTEFEPTKNGDTKKRGHVPISGAREPYGMPRRCARQISDQALPTGCETGNRYVSPIFRCTDRLRPPCPPVFTPALSIHFTRWRTPSPTRCGGLPNFRTFEAIRFKAPRYADASNKVGQRSFRHFDNVPVKPNIGSLMRPQRIIVDIQE